MSRWCVLLIAVAVFSAALSSPVPQEAVSRAGSVGAASAAFPASGGVATARTHHKFKKKHGFGTLPLYPGLYGYPLGLSYPLYGGFGYPSLGYGGLYSGFGFPYGYGYGLGGISPYGGGLF